MKAKYINPYTDFGFKKIFGEDASKPLLIDFLNALLPEQSKIIDLTFKNTEHLGLTEFDRKAVYDIYCENDRGEKFIVELQKAKQNYFIDRTIYYSTFPIQEQAEKGYWSYNLKAVYCIGILDFTFDDYESEPERSEVVHTVRLKNQNNKVFYEKLTYIYLEMPNFSKSEAELTTRLDKWLYFIKNLEDFQTIPSIFRDEVFEKAFQKAEIANMRLPELEKYQASLKIFRDNKAVFDYARETAFDDGRSQGIIEGKIEGKLTREREIALSLKERGMSAIEIHEITGLSMDEIRSL
ncbi:MAG: Rpn family recombination-promoting nuclease/putative transposase [Runella zeae]